MHLSLGYNVPSQDYSSHPMSMMTTTSWYTSTFTTTHH